MRKTIPGVALCVLVGLAPAAGLAQAVPAAFADGRKAYEAGQFEKARDLLLSASKTAARNAEVFLWLGKAHYQLGEIPEAIGAWQRTLRLAPGEPYAAKMLKALRAETRDVDVQIRLIRAAIQEELHDWARKACEALLARKSLTEAQRGVVTVLGAEARLGTNRHKEVPPIVLEIRTKYPKAVEPARLALLEARAKIRLDAESIVEARQALSTLAADEKDPAVAATAAYELLAFDLRQEVSAEAVGKLAAWYKANGDHELTGAALRLLVDSNLVLTRRGPRPARDAKPAASDLAAIGYLKALRARVPKEDERLKLTRGIDSHLQAHYDKAGAYAAAISLGEALLALDLSQAERAVVIERIMDRHMAVSRASGPIAAGAKLGAADLAALARARELLVLLTTDAEVQKVAEKVLAHLGGRYAAAGAHAAAIQGAEALRKPPVPSAARVAVLRQLVTWHLAAAAHRPRPARDAGLSASDRSALARARELLALLTKAADRQAIVRQLLSHFASYYAKGKAYAAAVQGTEAVLALPLARGDRLTALKTLAGYKTELAMVELTRLAAAGKLPAQMPAAVREVRALQATIGREYPAETIGTGLLALARRVLSLKGQLPAPAKVTALSAPDAWAVEIALSVVQADGEPKAVADAIGLVEVVRKQYLAVAPPTGLRIGLDLSARLAAAVAEDNPMWAAVRLAHADVLAALAEWQFAENVRTGKAAANAKLSETQKRMIAVLGELVARDARRQAAAAMQRLGKHLKTWLARGHYGVAEEAYALLVPALPAASGREARLAVAELWIRQVIEEQNRLLSLGLKLPEKLDATFVKALKRCYDLQAGLAEGDAFLGRVRTLWRSVVNHYVSLRYYATAAAAIQVKGDKPVPEADRYAELQLADHRLGEAQRELAILLRQYDGQTKLALTPAFRGALDAYKAFITRHAASPLAASAVRSALSVARTFEARQAYPVAAGIYKELAEFAAKIGTLSQAPAASASTAETAALAHAGALDAEARKVLAKWLAERKDKTPPAKILAEFTAAIAAYTQFIKDRPTGALVGAALRKIMAVALEYAKVDAWDVAEGIFADVLKSDLKLDSPERIELARAVCHLGKVMPDHARSVLTALAKGHGRRAGRPGGPGLALAGPGKKAEEEKGGAGRGRRGGKAKAPAPPAAKPVTTPGLLTGAGAAALALGEDLKSHAADEFERDEADLLALAAIRKQQATRARRVAQLRERLTYVDLAKTLSKTNKKVKRTQQQAQAPPPVPVLSDAELARQEKAFAAAYTILQSIRKTHPRRSAAEQARGEVMVMIGHWRAIGQWKRAAALADRYLTDNKTDFELPKLRLGIARDTLAWAAQPVKEEGTRQEKLAKVSQRFDEARAGLAQVVRDFAKDRPFIQQAQWDIANSFLTQARVVDRFSPTLARGQYVRAARELRAIAETFHDHPRISTIPQMLWSIAEELARRRYYDEALIVWNDLTIHYLTSPLAAQSALRIAQTYDQALGRPLKAAEAYVEINFAKGGNDAAAQNAIYAIGVRLKGQKRWVEALHVLETFVDSFPRHAQAGQALTTIGQIHQTNEAWQDAILAYKRVMEEFPKGTWVREAKWAIAECRINLSEWREAMGAYRAYVQAYAKDPRTKEATRRMGIAKDLARYQTLVDEQGQRKAFDAQFQIARIVEEQLTNPTKAIIEYRKVAANWPKTHLADDALFAVGNIYLSIGETARGRQALLALAGKYPESPLADDALYRVGQSYESEAVKLAAVTREGSIAKSKDIAQRDAYHQVQDGRRRMRADNDALVAAFRRQGQKKQAEVAQARFAANFLQYNLANTMVAAQAAEQQVEKLTAAQLADRQDKINAALRRAVGAYQQASKVATADKADEALLQMAQIYDERLKDSEAAMKTWLEIVRQFSGTSVAEDASWRIAQYHERKGQFAQAIQAYQAFLRNYRRSSRAAAGQFAIAENYEHLGEWVKAMDAYTNYINNFPKAPMVQKAREQISWIKTYRL